VEISYLVTLELAQNFATYSTQGINLRIYSYRKRQLVAHVAHRLLPFVSQDFSAADETGYPVDKNWRPYWRCSPLSPSPPVNIGMACLLNGIVSKTRLSLAKRDIPQHWPCLSPSKRYCQALPCLRRLFCSRGCHSPSQASQDCGWKLEAWREWAWGRSSCLRLVPSKQKGVHWIKPVWDTSLYRNRLLAEIDSWNVWAFP